MRPEPGSGLGSWSASTGHHGTVEGIVGLVSQTVFYVTLLCSPKDITSPLVTTHLVCTVGFAVCSAGFRPWGLSRMESGTRPATPVSRMGGYSLSPSRALSSPAWWGIPGTIPISYRIHLKQMPFCSAWHGPDTSIFKTPLSCSYGIWGPGSILAEASKCGIPCCQGPTKRGPGTSSLLPSFQSLTEDTFLGKLKGNLLCFELECSFRV